MNLAAKQTQTQCVDAPYQDTAKTHITSHNSIYDRQGSISK